MLEFMEIDIGQRRVNLKTALGGLALFVVGMATLGTDYKSFSKSRNYLMGRSWLQVSAGFTALAGLILFIRSFSMTSAVLDMVEDIPLVGDVIETAEDVVEEMTE